MPSLTDHQSKKITKLLLMGDSGSGKTGSLVGLVNAGYHLHILDFDNGLDSLVSNVQRVCPKNLGNVDFVSLRDKVKSSPAGPIMDGPPTAFVGALKLMDKWEDGSKPSTLGEDHVFVIDSLTFMSEAAYNWAGSMNQSAKDKRQIYGAAMDAVEHVLALLTGSNFATNVIVISHVKFLDRPDGTTKGYPTAIGNALSPKIGAYFNSVALCETKGSGTSMKRIIRTQSSALVDLKNPASFKLAQELPVETALADFFKAVRGN